MSYSGVRGPTLAGRFGGIVSATVSFAVLLFLAMFAIAHLHRGDNLLFEAAAFALAIVVGVALHESGHLLVGLAMGERPKQLRIGSGPTLFAFRLGNVLIQVCLNPLGGGAVYFSSTRDVAGVRRIVSLAAGPGINLLAAGYAFALWESGVLWLGIFAFVNAQLFIAGIMPAVATQGGRVHRSDGLQILDALTKPHMHATYFDGGELSADARDALVRALEDANLAGISEVGDEHLLRSLAQDPTLAALFKAHGIDHRIPLSPTPESDETSAARLSRTAHVILQMAFQKSRDLGNPRPNAAGLCLGLLSVECPAMRLLRDAGITAEELSPLAAVEADDEASRHREQVISADLPLERWGTAADKALSRAIEIAQAEHSTYLGTQQILAALVADPGCRAAQALERLRFRLVWKPVTPDQAGQSTAHSTAPIPSVQAQLAIAGALWRTGPNQPAGTAELCLGIIDHNAGIGAQILASAGVTAAGLIKALRSTEREASEAAGATPSIRPMYERRGFARLRAERWMDARTDFQVIERTSTTDRARAVSQNNIAWVSLLANDPALREEALELTRSAMAVAPEMPAISGTHAFALLENGFPAEAAALLEPVIPKLPRARDRASDLYLLAICYARIGRMQEAAQKCAEAQAADPKSPLASRAQAEVNEPRTTPVG